MLVGVNAGDREHLAAPPVQEPLGPHHGDGSSRLTPDWVDRQYGKNALRTSR